MKNKISVSVLGASGVVGQNFIALLDKHPWFELKAYYASSKRKLSQNTWYSTLEKPQNYEQIELQTLDIDEIAESSQVVFSALPAGIASKIEKQLIKRGIWVFSNASSYRMDPKIPIIIPEVNAKHLKLINKNQGASIITNSNCSTSGLVVTLAPFLKYGIKNCYVATYQALSGAGYPGVSAMDITGNLLPYINGEEEKIAKETKKILGTFKQNQIEVNPMQIIASSFRVNVPYGHTEAVFLELEQNIDKETAKQEFINFKGFDPDVTTLPSSPKEVIKVFEDPLRPQPKLDYLLGNGMTISVGSVKVQGKTLSFKLLVNNLIRGAAGGSVQNAELAYIKGYIK